MLLTTLLVLTLVIATSSELATLSMVESVAGARRARTLSHELAVGSALLLLEERLVQLQEGPLGLIAEMDRTGLAMASFEIGGVRVDCTIADDGAKLNPNRFSHDDQQLSLKRKLSLLGRLMPFDGSRIALRPLPSPPGAPTRQRYVWFDQLFEGLKAGALFRWEAEGGQPDTRHAWSGHAWSDVLTLWGDGRIDLRRVSPRVLDAALEDIRSGLGRRMLARRPADRSVDFRQDGLRLVDGEVRERVAQRLTFDAKRYAIRMDTSASSDRRRWYIVAQAAKDKLTILHRSQLTW